MNALISAQLHVHLLTGLRWTVATLNIICATTVITAITVHTPSPLFAHLQPKEIIKDDIQITLTHQLYWKINS